MQGGHALKTAVAVSAMNWILPDVSLLAVYLVNFTRSIGTTKIRPNPVRDRKVLSNAPPMIISVTMIVDEMA